jgi:glutamate carboxypeptidase
MNAPTQKPEERILSFLQERKAEMVSYLRRLVLAESPSTSPESQAEILAILRQTLGELGYVVEILPGERTSGQLMARPAESSHTRKQLLLGHCDTVWPIGTIKKMPFVFQDGLIRGPGVYDMKGGLTQIIFALKAIRSLGLEPTLGPIVFVNTDEEIGSIESDLHIRRLAQAVDRVFVLEPALGLSGKLKTARKGIGQFSIVVRGKASHAGLDPDKGISAIRELSSLIQKLYALSNPAGGVTVNVGIVEGGIRSNVVAPSASAQVDVRVPTLVDASRMESAILNLRPETPGAELTITGRIDRPPMERTRENQRLWRLAKSLGERIGLQLEQGTAGGGSDGNTTSQYVATLDGLGPVGDGAHADHEFIELDKMVERCALLALLILAP